MYRTRSARGRETSSCFCSRHWLLAVVAADLPHHGFRRDDSLHGASCAWRRDSAGALESARFSRATTHDRTSYCSRRRGARPCSGGRSPHRRADHRASCRRHSVLALDLSPDANPRHPHHSQGASSVAKRNAFRETGATPPAALGRRRKTLSGRRTAALIDSIGSRRLPATYFNVTVVFSGNSADDPPTMKV